MPEKITQCIGMEMLRSTSNHKKKFCVITGSRAEYGLLRWLMHGILEDSDLILQVIATGMHLSPEFGLTYEAIEHDGFHINRKVEMLTSSDTSVGIAKSIGLGLIGFADALSELNPDLIIVLGDRYEIFSAVTAALVGCIPVAHLHGGETTEGAYDESIRHSITKMSHYHFVANEIYKKRVLQLGEDPARVFNVGGLGVDNIKRLKLLNRKQLEDALDFKFGVKNLLITFHPVTLEGMDAAAQFSELLDALSKEKNIKYIFTLPNADTHGRILIEMTHQFVSQHPGSKAFASLGQLRYLSCVAQVDGVIGNSSSGLLEVPSLNKGSINIGDRQRGRLLAKSVINCDPNKESITQAINQLYSENFQKNLVKVVNPYGEGGASEKILKILKSSFTPNMVKKEFFDFSVLNNEGESN